MFSRSSEKGQTDGHALAGADDERGAVLVEYGLIILLVVTVAIAVLAGFGTAVLDLYSDNSDRFSGAVQHQIG